MPSVDTVQLFAISGTTFRLLSNFVMPLKMFWAISWSVSASAVAGSRVPKSSRIGNLSVWSAARPVPPLVLVPQAASATPPTTATARALRNRTENGVIAFSLGDKARVRAFPPPSSRQPSRGESAPTGGGGPCGPPSTPPSLLPYGSGKSTCDEHLGFELKRPSGIQAASRRFP